MQRSIPPPPGFAAIASSSNLPVRETRHTPKNDRERDLGQQIHVDMKRREMMHRRYNPTAKYMQYRNTLVDWMSDVGDELRQDPNFPFHASTIHVAVAYLDRLLTSADFERCNLPLVAMCVISIAAKFEEAEENIPNVEYLIQELNGTDRADILHAFMDDKEKSAYTRSATEFQQMEIQLLQQLDWNLTAVTPLHLLGFYRSEGFIFADDQIKNGNSSRTIASYMLKSSDNASTPRRVWSWCEFFADLCLRQYSFVAYPPSVLAAAVIVASRKALKIDPLWRPELTALTGLNTKLIEPCVNHLWGYYLQSFPPDELECREGCDRNNAAVGGGYLNDGNAEIETETSDDEESGGSSELDSTVDSDFMDVEVETGAGSGKGSSTHRSEHDNSSSSVTEDLQLEFLPVVPLVVLSNNGKGDGIDSTQFSSEKIDSSRHDRDRIDTTAKKSEDADWQFASS